LHDEGCSSDGCSSEDCSSGGLGAAVLAGTAVGAGVEAYRIICGARVGAGAPQCPKL